MELHSEQFDRAVAVVDAESAVLQEVEAQKTYDALFRWESKCVDDQMILRVSETAQSQNRYRGNANRAVAGRYDDGFSRCPDVVSQVGEHIGGNAGSGSAGIERHRSSEDVVRAVDGDRDVYQSF